jgi:uncharacterized protein (TIGR02246 family)
MVAPFVALGGAAAKAVASSRCAAAQARDIDDLTGRWQAALVAGDPDAIAALYAGDAVLLPAMGSAPLAGRAAIRAYFAAFVGRHALPTVTMRTVMAGCDMATEMGTARFLITGVRKGTRMFVAGRYTTVLTARDGQWLIAQQSLSLMPVPNRREGLRHQNAAGSRRQRQQQ